MRVAGILGSPAQSKLEKVLEKATRLNLKFFAKTVRRARRKNVRALMQMLCAPRFAAAIALMHGALEA